MGFVPKNYFTDLHQGFSEDTSYSYRLENKVSTQNSLVSGYSACHSASSSWDTNNGGCGWTRGIFFQKTADIVMDSLLSLPPVDSLGGLS